MTEQAFNLDAIVSLETPFDNESAFETELEFYDTFLKRLDITGNQIKKQLRKILSNTQVFEENGLFLQLCLELRAAQECLEYFGQRKSVLQSVADEKKRKQKS